jgi:hypothetical protein
MILRARVKAAHDLDGVTCCEKMMVSLLAFGQEIRVNPSAKLKKSRCQFCRTPFMGMRVENIKGWRIDPKYWEIEERGAA